MADAVTYKRLEAEGGDSPPPTKHASSPNPGQQVSPPAYTAAVVTVPPSGVKNGTDQVPPKDYFVHSILTILFCFMPLGIVALLKSVEVRSAVQRGDHATALTASRDARKYNKWSVILGVIILVVVLVFSVVVQLGWIIPLVIRANRDEDDDDDYHHGYHHKY